MSSKDLKKQVEQAAERLEDAEQAHEEFLAQAEAAQDKAEGQDFGDEIPEDVGQIASEMVQARAEAEVAGELLKKSANILKERKETHRKAKRELAKAEINELQSKAFEALPKAEKGMEIIREVVGEIQDIQQEAHSAYTAGNMNAQRSEDELGEKIQYQGKVSQIGGLTGHLQRCLSRWDAQYKDLQRSGRVK